MAAEVFLHTGGGRTYLPLFAVPRDTSEFRSTGAPSLKVERLLLRLNNEVGVVVVVVLYLVQDDDLPPGEFRLTPLVVGVILWVLVDSHSSACRGRFIHRDTVLE